MSWRSSTQCCNKNRVNDLRHLRPDTGRDSASQRRVEAGMERVRLWSVARRQACMMVSVVVVVVPLGLRLVLVHVIHGRGAGCKTPCTAMLSMDKMIGRNEQTMRLTTEDTQQLKQVQLPLSPNLVACELRGFSGMASETNEHGTGSCTDT